MVIINGIHWLKKNQCIFTLQILIQQQQQYMSDTQATQTAVQAIVQQSNEIYKQSLAVFEVCHLLCVT